MGVPNRGIWHTKLVRVVPGALLLFSPLLHAQAPQLKPPVAQAPSAPLPAQQQPSNPQNQNEAPPEEDESIAPETYVLNPLESDRNIRVGNYYWHKGKFRAAAGRYDRATRYNPSSAEAFYKLGEAQEKLKNRDAALVAYRKVVQLAPKSKLGHDAQKKLSKT